jgi:glyoxylase-like metal-dependent hydrolase (beta-lactamase superfamily II)
MIEKVVKNLYRIKIPLPRNPLKYVNSYLIKDKTRSLIVDTGFNMDECYMEMIDALRVLHVKPDKTDFFITHLHADHFGLIDRIASQSNVLVSSVEAPIAVEAIENPDYWIEIANFLEMNGFPSEELTNILKYHPGIRYNSTRTELQPVSDGEMLEYGDFSLSVILTPGHSPGHVCLYEPEKKLFFSGDHILFDITPNITWWPSLDNSLEEYLKSLEKVYELDVVATLPGHRNIYRNHRMRIKEIKEHHNQRLSEALNALRKGAKTAWEVAPHISWDIKFKEWDELPITQKWFAVGETIAHLIYLEKKRIVAREERDGSFLFFPV